MMKRIAMILCLTMMATIVVVAQDTPKAEAPKAEAKAPAALPSVDEILDKYVKAVGGKEVIEKQNSRVVKGSFDIEAMSMSGSFESYAKAPNKTTTIVTIPGFGVVNQVFDGEKGWSSDPMSGLRELAGAELAATKREADFYRDINLKKHFPKMEVKGREKVGSAEAFVVEATPAEGSPEKFYFDTVTSFLLRQDSERDNPQGKMPVEVYFENYKDVDGVKMPHTIRQVTPMFAMTIKFTEVKNNVAVEDSKFNKPSGQ